MSPVGDRQMPNTDGAQKMPATTGEQNMPNMPGMSNSSDLPRPTPVKHGPDHHGSGNQATPQVTRSRLDDPGIGLGKDERRVLVYTDLEKFAPLS